MIQGFMSKTRSALNSLGAIIAALAGVSPALDTYAPKVTFRGATGPRAVKREVPRGEERMRGPMIKAFRSYQVRYTNIFSRRAAVRRLNARAQHAKYELRNDDRADFLAGLAGAFPHF